MSPVRVLHVVGGMNQGGVETWLMHVMQHMDRRRFQFDFLVHSDRECVYDSDVRALGGNILPCPHPQRVWEYAVNFSNIIGGRAPYDVIHSHVHHFSGIVLALAAKLGIPKRIAHSHNDTFSVDGQAGWARRQYIRLCRYLLVSNATDCLSASRPAADSLLGRNFSDDRLTRILHCGIDLGGFVRGGICRDRMRADLNIAPDDFVIAHVGRFDAQKNHGKLLSIAAKYQERTGNVRLLLLGAGSLRPAMEARAKELGIRDRVIFAGVRRDVAEILMGTADLFLFPSLFEGLGLALVEAQAAGLPCVISDVVPREADVIPQLITRVALAEPDEVWCDALQRARGIPRMTSAAAVVENSRFNIRSSVDSLCAVYTA